MLTTKIVENLSAGSAYPDCDKECRQEPRHKQPLYRGDGFRGGNEERDVQAIKTRQKRFSASGVGEFRLTPENLELRRLLRTKCDLCQEDSESLLAETGFQSNKRYPMNIVYNRVLRLIRAVTIK